MADYDYLDRFDYFVSEYLYYGVPHMIDYVAEAVHKSRIGEITWLVNLVVRVLVIAGFVLIVPLVLLSGFGMILLILLATVDHWCRRAFRRRRKR